MCNILLFFDALETNSSSRVFYLAAQLKSVVVDEANDDEIGIQRVSRSADSLAAGLATLHLHHHQRNFFRNITQIAELDNVVILMVRYRVYGVVGPFVGEMVNLLSRPNRHQPMGREKPSDGLIWSVFSLSIRCKPFMISYNMMTQVRNKNNNQAWFPDTANRITAGNYTCWPTIECLTVGRAVEKHSRNRSNWKP